MIATSATATSKIVTPRSPSRGGASGRDFLIAGDFLELQFSFNEPAEAVRSVMPWYVAGTESVMPLLTRHWYEYRMGPHVPTISRAAPFTVRSAERARSG